MQTGVESAKGGFEMRMDAQRNRDKDQSRDAVTEDPRGFRRDSLPLLQLACNFLEKWYLCSEKQYCHKV